MDFKAATTPQLYTIAYHENCNPVDRVKALQELIKRKKQSHATSQAHIKRKIK